ncbi:TPA: hypothetical protein DEP58_02800 [Patescibacteria group bacterium]|nr:MAG: hypothetical protein UU98_C0027G0013 [Parcubacteria group bacterium GW2011_GWD2_42_14]HCC05212.1 hypothetical protein [Patescibacteria group bacterium]
MNRTLLSVLLVAVLFVVGFIFIYRGVSQTAEEQGTTLFRLPESPLFASFQINEKEVQLTDGIAEGVDAGLEEHVRMEAIVPPVYGDITGDARDDALLLLAHSENGGEKTYYIAVALKDEEGFLGMNAIPLERKEVPASVVVEDELAVVTYADETEVTEDGVVVAEQTYTQVYFALVGTTLQAVGPSRDGESVLRGEYVFSDELAFFTPCESDVRYSISPLSHSYAALEAIYIERTKEVEPNTPIYIVLIGSSTGGFSESEEDVDSTQTVDVSAIVAVPKDSSCTIEATQ